VKDEEPSPSLKPCRLESGLDQSGDSDLLGRQMSSKFINSTWNC